jgi:DNA mismatch repair protein MutS
MMNCDIIRCNDASPPAVPAHQKAVPRHHRPVSSGRFYETFDDDAKIVPSICNIVLTAREMGTRNRVPLAGVPYHAVDTYLARLIQAGHKVAIVEQTSDDATKGLMEREVVRVASPQPLPRM